MVSSPLEADGRGGDESHGGLEHLARCLDRLVLLLLHLIAVIKNQFLEHFLTRGLLVTVTVLKH